MFRKQYVNVKNVVKLCEEFANFWYKIIHDYMKNSSVHCIKYIVEENIHWSERLFWMICFLSSWILCSSQIKLTWFETELRPVSVLLETDRMNWNTKFPAITICQTGTELFASTLNNSNAAAIMEEIIFFSGRATFIKHCLNKLSNEQNPNCPEGDFSGLRKKFSKNCTELLKHCSWNNRDFDCCATFSPLQTELGICYSSGTLHSAVRNSAIDMTMNASQRNGNLNVDVNSSTAKVFIHSWEDVPNHNFVEDMTIELRNGINYWRYLKIIATESQPNVEEVEIMGRFCRYSHEMHGISSKAFQYYSPGVCMIDCRHKRMMELCNCVPHNHPGANSANSCNITGLLCIASHYKSIYVLSSNTKTNEKEEYIQCTCDDSCNHLYIKIIDQYFTARNDVNLSGVRIVVSNLPSERFNRVVVKDKLDKVVAVAGLVTLFLGTSLMTILEFFMFFFVRPWAMSLNHDVIIPFTK